MGLEKEEGIPPRVGAKWERILTGVHRTKIFVECLLNNFSKMFSHTVKKWHGSWSRGVGPQYSSVKIYGKG
jgi:hypothetical protein